MASSSDRRVTRRELLVAAGGAVAASTTGGEAAALREAPLHVRVYPGPVPLRAWVRYGFDGMRRNWPPPFRDALTAVEEALEQVLAYATARSRLEGVDLRVERGGPVRYPISAASPSLETLVPSLETVLEVFREQLQGRDVLTGSTCHLLLCWAPFNYRVGYGGTQSPHSRVGADSQGEGDAQTVANVGATELWDSRGVSRNIAIHEVLHTLISPDTAEGVAGSRCDHDLGTAVRTGDDDRILRISPMATAYAGPDRIGGGTRWHGTGCYDHGAFHRHDGTEEVDRFEYTTQLSDATLEAVTRYLEGRLTA